MRDYLAEAGQRAGRVFLVFSNRLRASIGPTIIPATVAERRGASRILFHLIIPFRFEECAERFSCVSVRTFTLRLGCVRQKLQKSEKERRGLKFS